ncbi:MAG: DNA repair protein RadC [Longimonas sp.]|uniref:RadC family protein n=1 Tax=Longimonas sp. TaxID=2039626 RepID=UPI00334C111C
MADSPHSAFNRPPSTSRQAAPQAPATSRTNQPGEPILAYQTPIHKWDPSDRPREKLIQGGPPGLSDAEILAILLGSGTRTSDGPVSAVQLGQTLLQAFGSLFDVSRRPLKELVRVSGVGPAKAARLMAAFEAGRRAASQRAGNEVQVGCPDDVAAVYGPLMRDLKKEIFKVVHLNTANTIISDYTVSEGGLAVSIVEPRAVFEQAILDNAASVICLHNHPSGNPEPSRQDVRITRQLVEAGKLMGIPVHDHIIIAGTTHTSLAERGVIE